MGDTYIRKSHLESYEWCPYQFKLVWFPFGKLVVDNPPADKRNILNGEGTRFHEFAKRFWDFDSAVDPEDWEILIPSAFNDDEYGMAAWWLEQERIRKTEVSEDEWRPVVRETKIVHRHLGLGSTVDRVDWWNRDSNEVAVVEYKTSRVKSEYRHFYIQSLIRQLTFYTILWQESTGLGNVTHLVAINPRMKWIDVLEPRDTAIDSVLEAVVNLRMAMKNSGPWPRKCSLKKWAICKRCSPSEVNFLFNKEEGYTYPK